MELVVIGASLGGPVALRTVFSGLPADFPAPVVVCQHIAAGMAGVLAEQLGKSGSLAVSIAKDREEMLPGNGYLAPIGTQLRFDKLDGRGRLRLDPDFADSLHVPSVDMMMSSAAKVFGSTVVGVLLTGMGSDGALGMHALRQAGAHTICESSETAVSHSMPGSAMELGAAAVDVPIGGVADAILGRALAD